jgi:hypothetical protein
MDIGIKLEFYAWDLSKGHPWKNLQIMDIQLLFLYI